VPDGTASPLPPPNRDLLMPNSKTQSPRASPKHSNNSSSSRAPSPRRSGSHSRPQSPGRSNGKHNREPEIELPPKRVRNDDATAADKEKEKEKERDKDRGRNRDRDRERDREREREKDKDKERERERDKDRDNNKRTTENDNSPQVPNKRSKDAVEADASNKRIRTTPSRSEQGGHRTPDVTRSGTESANDRKVARTQSDVSNSSSRTPRSR
jgi:hypothetical protein